MMRAMLREDFDAPSLDRTVWLPNYLPAWSSRAETEAVYEIRDSCLRLSIPPSRGLWMPDDHSTPLRLSGMQTGNFSGPVGSTIGQQPLAGGSVVREEQETFWGFTPQYGRLEMRARGVITPRSMVAWWMVGLEDSPSHCAEICVFEIFGDAVRPGSAEVGMGFKKFRDPDVAQDFSAPRLPIDPSSFHDYTVDWTEERAEFSVDNVLIRSCPRPPAYPMHMTIALFDFPDRSDGTDADAVPELIIDHLHQTA